MGDLTKNFSIYEFRQRNPYLPVPAEYRDNVQRLANQLQPLRDVVGQITLTSGWRSLAKNNKIGGATNSQHLTAKAADFTVPGVSNKDVYCAILRLIEQDKMEEGGLGWYGEKTANRTPHIHYDVRGFKRRWNETDGPLPVCPEIPAEEEEEDDMPNVIVKKRGSNNTLLTNGVTSLRIEELALRQQLQVMGVPGPITITAEYFDALWEAWKASQR